MSKYQQRLSGLFYKIVFFGCVCLSFLTSACQPTGGQKPSAAAFTINQNEVILDKSHIIAVKTKLYQPSFGLSGLVLPIQSANILAPTDGTLTVYAQKGQFVKKGDVLASIATPIIIAPEQALSQDVVSQAITQDTINQDALNQDAINQDIVSQKTTNQDNLDNLPSNTDTNTTPPQDEQADTTQDNLTTDTPINAPPKIITQTTPIKSPIDGVVQSVYGQDEKTQQNNAILQIADTRIFEFVARLPREYQNYLSIGQTVQFALLDQNKQNTNKQSINEQPNNQDATFAGQITQISPDNDELAVTVQIAKNPKLNKGMQLHAQIDYGQLSVGTIVPKHAITDGTSLNELHKPPYKPISPIHANIWIIGQDGTLNLTDIKVIEYLPRSQSYLVTGIDKASLIATANLPRHANHLPVRIR